ncbi:hypothetical protein [Kordia sp.]|uniref:hypothetical protein n=1 Tax=Kordia sp. TaxID=1965332 RepID=UPI003B5A4708
MSTELIIFIIIVVVLGPLLLVNTRRNKKRNSSLKNRAFMNDYMKNKREKEKDESIH